jgi:hypothetical protein
VQQKNSLKVKNSVDKALKKLWKIQKEVEFQRHGEDLRTGHPPRRNHTSVDAGVRPRSDMARVADPSGMIGKQSLDLRDPDSV